MCIVCYTFAHCPCLHCRSDLVSNLSFYSDTFFNCILQQFKSFFGKVFTHYRLIKYHRAKIFGSFFRRVFNFSYRSVQGFFECGKSKVWHIYTVLTIGFLIIINPKNVKIPFMIRSSNPIS